MQRLMLFPLKQSMDENRVVINMTLFYEYGGIFARFSGNKWTRWKINLDFCYTLEDKYKPYD